MESDSTSILLLAGSVSSALVAVAALRLAWTGLLPWEYRRLRESGGLLLAETRSLWPSLSERFRRR